jgi:hypothetical protein
LVNSEIKKYLTLCKIRQRIINYIFFIYRELIEANNCLSNNVCQMIQSQRKSIMKKDIKNGEDN